MSTREGAGTYSPNTGGAARRWLKKHFTNSDGTLTCEVVERDKQGPKTVRYLNVMTGKWSTWRRVMKADGDTLLEIDGSFD